MEARELSIGNLVMANVANDIIQLRVDEILWFDHLGYTLRMWVGKNRESKIDLPLHSAEPIPLTDELLFRCGFYTIDSAPNNEIHHNRGDFGLVYKNNAYYYGFTRFRVSDDGTVMLPRLVIQVSSNAISSVHQLQNLYFSITGGELEIKI